MTKKPTYKELEQSIKELKKENLLLKEHKHSTETLKKRESRYRAVVDNQIEMICCFLPDETITFVNDAYCRFFNKKRKELIGKKFAPLIPQNDRKKVLETISSLSPDASIVTLEHQVLAPDKKLCWHRWTNRAIFDDQNNLLEYQAVGWNITERKQAEDALRESEEKFRFLAENMADIIWIIDRDFQTTYVSPSIENVLGFTPEERKRQTLEEMIAPDSLQSVQMKFLEELQRDEEGTVDPDRPVIIEVEYYHKEGSTVWVENIVKAIRGPGGAIVGMHGVSRDINERKQAEEALKEREVELARKNLRLEELNSALKILLEKRNQDKTELEENVLTNMKELILPYVEKLKKADLSNKQEVFADILQSNLENIVSPFARKLKSKYLGFTPTELKVANLVKQGLSTKEIADLLNSSPETISGHRKSMRKKLKLTDKKSNLRTHLLSLNNG